MLSKTPLGNEMGKRYEKVRKLSPKGTQNETQNRPKFVQNRTGRLQGGAGGRQAGPERQKRTSGASPVRIFHQNLLKIHQKRGKKGRRKGEHRWSGKKGAAVTPLPRRVKKARSAGNGKVVWGESGRKGATATPLGH